MSLEAMTVTLKSKLLSRQPTPKGYACVLYQLQLLYQANINHEELAGIPVRVDGSRVRLCPGQQIRELQHGRHHPEREDTPGILQMRHG